MSVKCPACGFDSPDEALYCDFCKEPFKKHAATKAPAAQAQPPQTAPAAQELTKLSPEELFKRLPTELLKDAEQEKLPTWPQWFRVFAWLFLGAWLMLAIGASLMLFMRGGAKAPSGGESQPQQPAPPTSAPTQEPTPTPTPVL